MIELEKTLLTPIHKHKRAAVANIFFLGAFLFSYHFTLLRLMQNVRYKRATLSSLPNFTAQIRFQYRVLVPWPVRLFSGLVPSFHIAPQIRITSSVPIEQAGAVVMEILRMNRKPLILGRQRS
jgi:hypothetical protein